MIPLASHFKIYLGLCPNTDEEFFFISCIPYGNVVDSLMYLMVCTRLDISHAFGVVNRHMENLGKEIWAIMKWVLWYLRGTRNFCITFDCSSDVIHDCVDLDLQVTWTKEGPLLDIYLISQVQQLVGCQSFKTLFLYPRHR